MFEKGALVVTPVRYRNSHVWMWPSEVVEVSKVSKSRTFFVLRHMHTHKMGTPDRRVSLDFAEKNVKLANYMDNVMTLMKVEQSGVLDAVDSSIVTLMWRDYYKACSRLLREMNRRRKVIRQTLASVSPILEERLIQAKKCPPEQRLEICRDVILKFFEEYEQVGCHLSAHLDVCATKFDEDSDECCYPLCREYKMYVTFTRRNRIYAEKECIKD